LEEGDLLLNGHLSRGDVLRGKTAAVEVPMGPGHVIVLAPDVPYRSAAGYPVSREGKGEQDPRRDLEAVVAAVLTELQQTSKHQDYGCGW
jgi:hypothetical protein